MLIERLESRQSLPDLPGRKTVMYRVRFVRNRSKTL